MRPSSSFEVPVLAKEERRRSERRRTPRSFIFLPTSLHPAILTLEGFIVAYTVSIVLSHDDTLIVALLLFPAISGSHGFHVGGAPRAMEAG